ncbi:cell wall-binding repeat-containing protein [Catenulispora sp. NF23]|uniref:cell wall-binding repeat-containing protein n=1 Tax=Catenulispora pinistramenti TaxID=2705254 RepID=UPI001BA84F0C|nr:cell wall-binding repeat-containing protein [Catenulispora pinistramenti]MBS2536069.1 cell wall-binding repeat-containing protein [Catenulispora pinistramenti]
MRTSAQRRALTLGAVGSIMGAGVGLVPAISAHADTPTMSSGNLRDGWDSNEPGLSPYNVATNFGQTFATQLTNADGTPDTGHIFAEPTVINGTLIVANENNNVYGLDPVTGAIKWRRNVGPAWPAPQAIGCNDLTPTVGITSSPVYDPATNALYFTDKQNDPDMQHPSWFMHAVDPATGAEKPGFPVKIGGSPTNDPSNTFNSEYQMQRPGLLLLDGVVYAGFGDHCALNPPAPAQGYRGYVVGIDTATAKQTTMWTDSMESSDNPKIGAGIWASGGALMSDGDGNILLTSGNGDAPALGPGNNPPATLGDSVIRLHVNADKSLTPVDFFSPANADVLGTTDADLGSGSPTGLPDGFFGPKSTVQRTLVQQGKDGRLFLLNRDNLGGRTTDDSGALQVLNLPTRQWGREAVYGGDGGYVYDIGLNSPLRALKAGVDSTGKPQLTQTGTSSNTFGYFAASPVVTSDGTASGSGVVWTVDPTTEGTTGAPAQLTAYNAVPDANGNLQKLYSAPVGSATKFSTPVTDGNRVYVGNYTGVVYGFGVYPPVVGHAVVSRESGADRYATGVAVSQSVWADAGGDKTGRKRAQAVVLARGDAFPDALAGVPLASKANGPLLLTQPKTLPSETLNEIRRVLPAGGTVYVLGGTDAISAPVAQKLVQLGYHVTRYGGADRYATALQIAQQGLGNPAKVMLATGLDYADALAAGPFAATGPASSGGSPAAILLTNGKKMDPATAAYVAGKARSSTAAAPTVYAVGGPAATAAKSLPGYIRTFSGYDRYATDAQLVQAQSGVPFVGVAVGTNFADALTGGAATAEKKGALVTVPSTLPAPTAHLLTSLAPALQALDVFGGPVVIPDPELTAITRAVGGHPA